MSVGPSRRRSSSSTATATTWCCPAERGSRRPRRSSGESSWSTSSRASAARVLSRRWSTSVRSSTSGEWTDWSTCPSCRGSTSIIRHRWCRWATRSTSRCSTWTCPRSASACRSRLPRPIHGRSSPTRTRWGNLSTDESPSWCRSARSSMSETAGHHVDLPEQVVTPGEELWVKIIDIDLQRRRISLSIKQAAEGGEVSEEYREAFGEHAYDAEGNYVGPFEFAETEFTPETEAQAAWVDYVAEHGPGEGTAEAPAVEPAAAETAAVEAPAE